MLTAVCDSFSRSYLECRPAQSGCVSADHKAHSNWCGPSPDTGLSVNIKDIDPVARLRRLIVQKPPGAVCLLVELWCAKEGLPRVPYWLRQRQGASDGCLSFGHLKFEGNLVERALKYVGDVRAFDFPARPFGFPVSCSEKFFLCKSSDGGLLVQVTAGYWFRGPGCAPGGCRDGGRGWFRG